RYFFPPRLVCPCGNRELEAKKLPDEGKLLTFTIIHTPGAQFDDQKPFAIGIVELARGARITTQIVDTPFDEIEIGMKVKIQFRKIQSVGDSGILAYGYKVVPK
ncbi:MAG: Zn-ribbon domain-containing OB-fold protein, partial [bacterium]|nr:Zn-ribbon domain-containing OB-fold protein [bacterium]